MKAVVFDLDGTLVDSAPDIAWSINAMLATYALPPLDVRDVEKLTGEGASVLVERALAAVGVTADAERVRRDTDTYLAHYRARPCVSSTLFADARTVLPQLRGSGLRLGICTNKPEELARVVLAALDIAGEFAAVVGADTTPARKPDPRPLLHTLDLLGVTPADAIYVGDTRIDAECAAAAGVACRLVAWRVDAATRPITEPGLARFAELLA